MMIIMFGILAFGLLSALVGYSTYEAEKARIMSENEEL